jgi:DNA-binding SARP family transcriptional activator
MSMALLLCLSDVAHVERAGAAPLPLAPRDGALLAWLAIEGPTARDQLAALLWPASAQAQARNVLRQRLFQLKKVLGVDIAAGSPLLALAEDVVHDLDESVELLGTLTFPDAPEFDAWLARQRKRLQQREAESPACAGAGARRCRRRRSGTAGGAGPPAARTFVGSGAPARHPAAVPVR